MVWKGAELEDLLEKAAGEKELFNGSESTDDYIIEAIYDIEKAEWTVQLFNRKSPQSKSLYDEDIDTYDLQDKPVRNTRVETAYSRAK